MAEKIPRWEDMYGSTYLSPEDLPANKTFEAVFITQKPVKVFCKGKHSLRVVVTATVNGKPSKKPICINKTSAKALSRVWGKDDFNQWLNKPVTIRRGAVNGKPAILIAPVGEADGGDESLEYQGDIPEGADNG